MLLNRFEVVELLRKLLLCSVLINFVNDTSTSYVNASFLFSILMMVLVLYTKPYMSPMLDKSWVSNFGLV